jgi:hypothetical protein
MMKRLGNYCGSILTIEDTRYLLFHIWETARFVESRDANAL